MISERDSARGDPSRVVGEVASIDPGAGGNGEATTLKGAGEIAGPILGTIIGERAAIMGLG